MLTITPLYLAIAVFMYSGLAFFVIKNRRSYKVSIGDGGHAEFAHIIRGHGNFSEYVPLALLAIAVAELSGAPSSIIHAAGISLITGRTLHAIYFLSARKIMKVRVAGMMLTFLSLWGAAIAALGVYL